MKIDLSKYTDTNICVAVSGGRDSMALLHYLLARGGEYGISVSAVNLDHKMREQTSALDSAFVAGYCNERGVPLAFFEWNDGKVKKSEGAARIWRRERYADAAEHFNAVIATAHHLNDNAETVLFNLARGSGLAGLTGINETCVASSGKNSQKQFKIIRPLIACTREEIDEYIAKNNVPYVDDETNFTNDYTRNIIRHNVLPELEKVVDGASKAIFRLSRIAAEDEEYFEKLITDREIVKRTHWGYEISRCDEKPVFKRAVLKVISDCGVKDYTFEQLERLYQLQFAPKAKKFEFLGLTAFKEEGKIAIRVNFLSHLSQIDYPFFAYLDSHLAEFFNQPLYIEREQNFKCEFAEFVANCKALKFDLDKIPATAVIRTMREGDKFKKFGGGTKNLGDYFTDKKIPVRIRKSIPVIADGCQVLIVCGVEISQTVKVDEDTKAVALCVAADYTRL